MGPKSQREAKNEVSILKSLNHPHIVKYFDSFIDGGCLNIIMEYCKEGKGQAYRFFTFLNNFSQQ